MSDMDNEELEATRNKTVRQAYDTVYTEMCRYMELYNQAVDDIQENYYSKDKILKALGIEYRNQDLSEDRICSLIESLLKEKRRVEQKLKNIKYYYKKGDKWYAHYKETQVDKTKVKELEEQAKSKVTEKELKDMILGMLE